MANLLGIKKLYLKDDGRNPSASFKDRASAVAYVRARETGAKVITGASTGNAASALSCITASVDFPTVIFVPKTAPRAKITQLLVFGAKVIAVDGTYDDAFDLCLKVTEKYGWYNRNTGYNPFTREGKKTCAYEICEQLNWKVPDKVFVSVGDGNIISGIWKGFKDLKAIGLIKKLPKIVGVQSSKSNAVYKAWKNKTKIKPVKATTIADSISVDFPRDGDFALRAVIESDGFMVEVSDKEILSAIKKVARGAGVFGEPAGVTSYAGIEKAVKEKLVSKNDVCVVIITGNGLKDIDSAMKTVKAPFLIKPDLNSFSKLVKKLNLK